MFKGSPIDVHGVLATVSFDTVSLKKLKGQQVGAVSIIVNKWIVPSVKLKHQVAIKKAVDKVDCFKVLQNRIIKFNMLVQRNSHIISHLKARNVVIQQKQGLS